jgi:putative transposase
MEIEIERKGSNECKRLVEVVWEKPDRFYVCFTYTKANQEKPTEDHPTAAALDPGVRTFQTGYDSSGNFFEAGKGAIRRVERLCLDLDRLISKAAGVKTGHKKRYKRRRMNAAIQRARQRIKNLI